MIEQSISIGVTLLSSLLTGLIVAILIKRGLRNTIQELITQFMEPPAEGKPSLLESYMHKIGEGLALSMRNSFAGQISGDVRLGKAVDKAVGMDVMDQSGIGGILDLVGATNVKQLLAKNPQTLALILQRFGPLISQFMGQKGLLNTQQTQSGNTGFDFK